MNLEGLTLHILTKELERELLGSKIYKIYMPSPHAVLFMVRRMRDTTAILADLSGDSPALYIPDKLPETPEMPPSFCMLLRKHLEEGRITKIAQSGLDRVITLEVDLLGMQSKLVTKKLVVELAGKNSNLMLVQANDEGEDIIIDSLKHIGAAQSSYRTILPGKPYIAPPPQDGLNILESNPADIVAAANALPAANFGKALVAATTGIGKATANELLAAADIVPQEVKLDAAAAQALADVLGSLQAKVNGTAEDVPPQEQAKNSANAEFSKPNLPVYALISRTNSVKTILPMEPKVLEQGMKVLPFDDINSAINYAKSLTPIQLPQHENLQKIVASETSKLQKKMMALQNDLAHAENAEEERMKADTLMASIYQIKKGQTKAEVINIYTGEPITIALSPILSPTDNAQAYYKRYNKYKRAQGEVRLQIEATQDMLAYLESLDASLMTATSKNEMAEIKQEMTSAGLIKEVGKKHKMALAKSQPLHYKLPSGTDIYIGKNNKQNDYVTFTIAGPRDLWLHTKDIPGSHVVIKAQHVSDDELNLAVQIAAYYSKARTGSNVPVDVVERRYVKKPSGSKPGFVIFTNNKTYYTTPNLEQIKAYIE